MICTVKESELSFPMLLAPKTMYQRIFQDWEDWRKFSQILPSKT